MTAYLVTAPLVVAPDEAGRSHHRYAGQLILWLSDASREHLLGLGLVEEVADPVSPGVVPTEDALNEPPAPVDEPVGAELVVDPTVRPAQTAPKPAWVAHVAAVAGVDPAEAEKLSKPELIALAGN